MNTKLNNYYQSAEKVLSNCIKSTKCVCISDYKQTYAKLNCAILQWNINNAGKGLEGDNSANMTLTLAYTAVVTADEGCQTANKQMTLNILSPIADDKWGPIMRARVWKNNYPAAVGIETTGEVYFVYLHDYGLELCYFAQLTESELSNLETIKLDAPYEISIAPDTLFKVIEGDVGNEEMRKNIYVQFNCAVNMKVAYRERLCGDVEENVDCT